MSLTEIKNVVAKELREFEDFFDKTLSDESLILQKLLNYLRKRKGKLIRPTLVILSAKISGEINEKTYVGATLIELLHTATLIHDDVVDNSELRRNFFSFKALWGNKIAVLVGDYLLSKGLSISVKYNTFNFLKIVSEAVELMAKGEIIQLKNSKTKKISEDIYFSIIEKKTATLISAAMKIGAESVHAKPSYINALNEFATNLGLAFQIKDDLLDLTRSSGKSFANDIREGKVTLPLIKSLESNNAQKRTILKLLNKKKKSTSDIKFIVDFIERNGGIQKTEDKLKEISNKAIKSLDIFPDSQIKRALIKLIEFNQNRTK